MNKKRVSMVLAVAMLALSLNACGGKKEGETKKGSEQQTSTKSMQSEVKEQSELNAQDIKTVADRLLKEIKYDDTLESMQDGMMQTLYPSLPTDEVKEAAVYLPSAGSTAEEIACFEAKSEEGAEAIKKAMEERVELQKASFKNYVPEELKRLDKAVIEKKGNAVFFSVSGDPDKAKEIIEGK